MYAASKIQVKSACKVSPVKKVPLAALGEVTDILAVFFNYVCYTARQHLCLRL